MGGMQMKTITEFDPGNNTYRISNIIPDVEIMFRPEDLRHAVFNELTKSIAKELMSKVNITFNKVKK